MKQLLSSLLLLLLFPLMVHAVIAVPGKRIVTLADGSRVVLTLVGDEHLHYYLTSDGHPVRLLPDSTLQPIDSLTFQFLQQRAVKQRLQSNNRRLQRRRSNGQITPLTGQKRGVVLLVNFSDNAFSLDDPQAYYNDFFNRLNYQTDTMTGSVRDYFLSQSYGQFDMQFDVIGPITVSHPMAYYGSSSLYYNDSIPSDMVVEACLAADSLVNFHDYDWDKDGYVDQVFIVYAGYGENYDAPSYTIWPHESQILQQLELDGEQIRTYACTCELRGDGTEAEKTIDGIGTACHEFSHCLGFPDFYNTSYGQRSSLSTWDVLDAGSYNNKCRTPAGYTSYERWQAGWLTPTEITSATQIKDMKPLSESPEAYILYNDAHPDEYYLLENRQPVGFDAGLYGHGLIILHVDYNESDWVGNTVNSLSKHERLGLVTADGNSTYSATGMQGDPFPGSSGNTMFTDISTPAATLFNANTDGTTYLHKPVECITEGDDGLVSFLAMYPALEAPQLALTVNSQSSFSLAWDPVEGATGYEISITETPAKKSPAQANVLSEDFGDSNLVTDKYKSPVFWPAETGDATIVMTLKPLTQGVKAIGYVELYINYKDHEFFDFTLDHDTTLVLHSSTVLDQLFRVDVICMLSSFYITHLDVYDGNYTAQELGIDETAAKQRRRVKSQSITTSTPGYTFTGLNSTSQYLVQVRSLQNGRISEWSDPVEIVLADEDAIQAVPAMQPSEMAEATKIYDLQGRRIAMPHKSGIYIKSGKKFLVK